MKIIQLIGGLGNQMFQYAFYFALNTRFSDVKLDTSSLGIYSHNGFELERIFDVKYSKASLMDRMSLSYQGNELFFKLLRIFLKKKKTEYIEPYLGFNKNILSFTDDRYYIGYWQSYKYFNSLEFNIREEFKFPESLNAKNEAIRNVMINANSVSIHVRLGDYLNNPIYSDICTQHYYDDAIELIKKRISEPIFFIFSDDAIWCRNNLKLANCYIIDWNINKESFWDMYLMSCCKHNIIANSTFSWWGAWLNANPDKIVISPKRWINDSRVCIDDIIPQSWICI